MLQKPNKIYKQFGAYTAKNPPKIGIYRGRNILTRIVDIGAIINKIKETRHKCGAGIMLIAKADCYGAGAHCAKQLTSHVDYFGVAKALEGARLRNLGIELPILVLSHSREQLSVEKEFGLIPAVSTAEDLSAADSAGIKEVHICIDTGMNRNGFKNQAAIYDKNEIEAFYNNDLKNAVNSIKNVQISGVFSHICHNGKVNAVRQSRLFDASARYVGDITSKTPMRHLWASSGIEFISDYGLPVYDTVRLGIAAYEKANYVISSVISVKSVNKGECIGYESAYTAGRDMRIAVVEGGYCDGIPRSMRNGYVIINGVRADIVGYVCMDVFMADVSDIDCVPGDSVVLLDNDLITLEDIAMRTNSCKYEVLTRLRGRNKYVYLLD